MQLQIAAKPSALFCHLANANEDLFRILLAKYFGAYIACSYVLRQAFLQYSSAFDVVRLSL